MSQADISSNNSEFWNELCGSGLAKFLGVTDSSPQSLRKFDDWYFDFYPYLFDHIPFKTMKGMNVLEVGLGYGTVSQRLAESGAEYTGLDIAQGPVSMVNQRLAQNDLPGKAIQGSILEPQLAVASFDYVIAIGCLHHTGNLKLAIEQCHSLLKPGGQLIFMVYYAYSYRRFRMAPLLTIKSMMKEMLGFRGVVGEGSDRQRAAYDASSEGDGAPQLLGTSPPPISGRPFDIVYRGRTLRPELGRFAQEKRLIGEQVLAAAPANGLASPAAAALSTTVDGCTAPPASAALGPPACRARAETAATPR